MAKSLYQRLQPTAADRALSLLVAVLALYIFVVSPLAEMGVVNARFVDAALVLMLAIGVAAIVRKSIPAWLFVTIAIACALVRIFDDWFPSRALSIADALLAGTAFAMLAGLVIAQVLRDHEVNLHEILGAIAAFLLISLAFTQAYRLVAMLSHGAFLWQGTPTSFAEIANKLPYFSLVTLSTLGYGDIVPAHPFARALANFQAIIGIFYPAVLVAHLVSLEIESSRRNPRVSGED